MDIASHPASAGQVGSNLLLADRVLGAFESGRLAMHAGDFRQIAGWAFSAFAQLEVESLRTIAPHLQGPLKDIAQNVLFIHGDSGWATDPWNNRIVENEWATLLAAMRA